MQVLHKTATDMHNVERDAGMLKGSNKEDKTRRGGARRQEGDDDATLSGPHAS